MSLIYFHTFSGITVQGAGDNTYVDVPLSIIKVIPTRVWSDDEEVFLQEPLSGAFSVGNRLILPALFSGKVVDIETWSFSFLEGSTVATNATLSSMAQQAIEYIGDDVGDLQRRVGLLEYVESTKPEEPEDTGTGDGNADDDSDTNNSTPDNNSTSVDFWAETQQAFKEPLTDLVDNSHVDLTEIVLILRADRGRLAEVVE